MIRRHITRAAGLALALTTLVGGSPTHAQTLRAQAQLIGPGRLALPASAFGRGASFLDRHIDWTAKEVNTDNILADQPKDEQQGQLYASLHAVGSLFESARLPDTAASGDARAVDFMATRFATTGAAQAAWGADTAFLNAYWSRHPDKPTLVAVGGRYSTRAYRIPNAGGFSVVGVTAVVGNVEITLTAYNYADSLASAHQAVADASTVLRAAFAAYSRLPVTRGPAPVMPKVVRYVPPTATPIPQPTATPMSQMHYLVDLHATGVY